MIRRRFKWVMILLGVMFLLTFVLLGVGSGSSGISDILSNFFSGSSATGSSLSSLQKQTTEHPKDAAAFLALANKLQADNKDDEAATALTTYTTLKPKDQNALLQLAGIYLRRAQAWDTLYNNSQARAQALTPTSPFAPSSSSAIGKALGSVATPITSAASSATSSATSNEYSQVINYLNQREGVYKKLAKLSPRDAITQFQLAQSATDAGDTKTAIAGYKAFLKLAPSDSQAPAARKALKQLEAQEKATASASAGSTKATTSSSGSSKTKAKTSSKGGSKKKS
jgi:cytochrome c-type biogenesis protein CcmH/NrfG